MSEKDVIKFLKLLSEDEVFFYKFSRQEKNKDEKLNLIESYGLQFSEEEFDEVMKKSCINQQNTQNKDNIQLKELNDAELEPVAGGLDIGKFAFNSFETLRHGLNLLSNIESKKHRSSNIRRIKKAIDNIAKSF